MMNEVDLLSDQAAADSRLHGPKDDCPDFGGPATLTYPSLPATIRSSTPSKASALNESMKACVDDGYAAAAPVDRLMLQACCNININDQGQSQKQTAAACTSMGMHRFDQKLGSVKLAKARETNLANKRRAAICLTGQLRTLPATYPSWRSVLFPLMQAGGLELDLFVITSASASLETWFPLLQSAIVLWAIG